MKVYAVERGEYSDYHVVAMFTTRDAAQQAIDSLTAKYGDERVVEWEVYSEVPTPYVIYTKEFYGGQVQERELTRDGWEDPRGYYVGRWGRGLGFGKWTNSWGRCYRYWGTDKARVHKAFDDYHAQRLAEQAGVA